MRPVECNSGFTAEQSCVVIYYYKRAAAAAAARDGRVRARHARGSRRWRVLRPGRPT